MVNVMELSVELSERHLEWPPLPLSARISGPLSKHLPVTIYFSPSSIFSGIATNICAILGLFLPTEPGPLFLPASMQKQLVLYYIVRKGKAAQIKFLSDCEKVKQTLT